MRKISLWNVQQEHSMYEKSTKINIHDHLKKSLIFLLQKKITAY